MICSFHDGVAIRKQESTKTKNSALSSYINAKHICFLLDVNSVFIIITAAFKNIDSKVMKSASSVGSFRLICRKLWVIAYESSNFENPLEYFPRDWQTQTDALEPVRFA